MMSVLVSLIVALALVPSSFALSHVLQPSSKLTLERMTSNVNAPEHRVHMRCQSKFLDARDPSNYCSEKYLRGTLAVGELCLLRPQQANPTQMSVGKVVAHCLEKMLERMDADQLESFLMEQQLPTVVGPDAPEGFWITDKHHLVYALFSASFEGFKHPLQHRTIYACIDSDFRNTTKPEFQQILKGRSDIYLKDEYGRDVDHHDIPHMVKDMEDDPYRTLAEWVLESRGFIKCGAEKTRRLEQCVTQGDAPYFLEFMWANWLRERLPVIDDASEPKVQPPIEDYIYNANLQSQFQNLKLLLSKALDLALSTEAQSMPGYNWSRDKLPPAMVDIDDQGCTWDLPY